MKSFVRFAALSGGGWLLDCILLLIWVRLGMGLGVANFASSLIAALGVFMVSRRLVFKPARVSVFPEALFYSGYQVLNILLASMLIGPVAKIGRAGLQAFGWLPDLEWIAFTGKVLVTPPQLVCNFMVSRFLVQYWRRPSSHA